MQYPQPHRSCDRPAAQIGRPQIADTFLEDRHSIRPADPRGDYRGRHHQHRLELGTTHRILERIHLRTHRLAPILRRPLVG